MAVLKETQENELSRFSIPRLSVTVAIIQDYLDPESYLVVDFTQHLRLCRLNRESFQVVNLIDGKKCIQEIADAVDQTKMRQDSLNFFRSLHALRVLDF